MSSHVTVTIDERSYRMACDPGQEEHLLGLAGKVDEIVKGLRESFGEIGDQRIAMMAAVIVADELDEVTKKATRLELELKELKSLRQLDLSERETTAKVTAERITAAAGKLSQMAEKLSPGGTAPKATVSAQNGVKEVEDVEEQVARA